MFNLLQHGGMGDGGYGVGFSGESDFVVVFHDPAFLDSFLDPRKVLVSESEEGDMIRHLPLDRPDGGGAWGRFGGEVGVQLGGGKDGIDVVALESFGG